MAKYWSTWSYTKKWPNIGQHGLRMSPNLELEFHQIELNIQEIRICLKKKDADWWPRLLYEQKKLAWLKIDFEKWKTNDTDDSENDEASKLLQG